MRISMCLIFVGMLLIAACGDLKGNAIEFQSDSEQQQSPQAGAECTSNVDCPAGEICVNSVCGTLQSTTPVRKTTCVQNSDCTDSVCIDGTCEKLEELYLPQTCEAKCSVKRVVVKTSDGETYDFVPGKGSYTGAGALEWRLVKGPNHCSGEQAKVPVQITRRQYGKVISEEYITLAEKVPSKILTHPSVTTLAFTLTADVVEEQCS